MTGHLYFSPCHAFQCLRYIRLQHFRYSLYSIESCISFEKGTQKVLYERSESYSLPCFDVRSPCCDKIFNGSTKQKFYIETVENIAQNRGGRPLHLPPKPCYHILVPFENKAFALLYISIHFFCLTNIKQKYSLT